MPALITDFGAKIGGARKDLARGNILPSDIPAMSAEERKHWVTKSMIWPAADYEALLAAGTERPVLFAIKALRDSLPDCVDLSPQSQGNYVAYLNELRGLEKIRTAAEAKVFVQGLDRLGIRMNDNSQGFDREFMLHDFGYQERKSHMNALWAVNSYLVDAAKKPDPAQHLPYKYDAAFAFYRRNEEWPTGNAAWQQWARRRGVGVHPFPIQAGQGEARWVVGRYSSNYTREHYRPPVLGFNEIGQPISLIVAISYGCTTPTTFATKEEATSTLKAAVEAILGAKKQTAIAERKAAKARAEGAAAPAAGAVTTEKSWITPGTTVTGDIFLHEFGFRGGEFGHWVSQRQRREVLDRGYNAMQDLAEVLGIPPIMLAHSRALPDGDIDHGSLGIGFGSRGRGGINAAAAHFEPTYNVINLTKPNGAGCLAHEWAHSLDFAAYALARELQKPYPAERLFNMEHTPDADGHDSFLSDYVVTRVKNGPLPHEVEAIIALNEAMDGIAGGRMTDAEVMASRARNYDSAVSAYSGWMQSAIHTWKERNSLATPQQAKAFTDQFAELAQPILKGEYTDSQKAELEAFLARRVKGNKQAIDQIIRAWPMTLRARAAALRSTEISDPERKSSTSAYKTACKKVDGLKKPYYGTRVEMFARAFEAWVHDRLTAEGRVSSYLIRGTAGEAYPQGEERRRTNALVDTAVRKWALVAHDRSGPLQEALALRKACGFVADPTEASAPLPESVASPAGAGRTH